MENIGIKDILDVIGKNYEKTIIAGVKRGGVSLISSISPVAKGTTCFIEPFLSGLEEFKLYWFLVGYSNGLDCERKLNDLYAYAQKPENAFLLGNIFKKIFSAETVKVCVLQGMLLSEHIVGNRGYERDDLIICKALENATDYDLEYFKYLMENCIENNKGVKKIVINENDPNANDCEITQNWGIYNRIFRANMKNFFTFENETLGMMNPPTYVESVAEKLYGMIKEGQQIWNY